ncbi:MAG: LysR family transcriptional regulator [Pseudomonadales bacterium]|nr:LysR family transcriptional regulator [Pseudomonadales bacterium]
MNDQVSWDDIRVFAAVGECGSLSQAAKRLNVSQPTVGRRIQALEQALGFTLFQRSPNGYELTDTGRQLLPLASGLQQTAQQFFQSARACVPSAAGRVRITCGETFGRFLIEHIPVFNQLYPGIAIDVITGFGFLNLDKGEADIAVRNIRPNNPNLIVKQLGQSAYAIYGAKNYIASDPYAESELRYQYSRWVAFNQGETMPPSLSWLLERVDSANIGLQCNSTSLLLDAVKRGHGLAALPCSLAAQADDLVRLTPVLEDLKNTLWLVLQRDAKRIEAVSLVADWLGRLFDSNRFLFMPEQ